MIVQKLVVLGGGESGVGAAILGMAKGFEVFLSDRDLLLDKYRKVLLDYKIRFEEGGHTVSEILNADLVVKSPGIPDKVPLIISLKEKGISIISEIEFASRYTTAKLIAITGSNGKTTTTLLTYHILQRAGLNVGLAGNIGDSFAWQVAEKQFDYYVLEISSFQLDNIKSFHPAVAVILNITPDHLDRYEYNFQNYTDSKFAVIRNQTEADDFIFFADSEVIEAEIGKRNIRPNCWGISLIRELIAGAYMQGGKLISKYGKHIYERDFAELPIKGPHNAINAMASILVSQSVGVSDADIREGLISFTNAPHRLEKVATIHEVTYINDSKATNVDSVYYALGSFEQPVILIAGGVDKGNDYSQIEALVREKVKGLIILTPDAEKLRSYFKDIVKHIYVTQDMEDAVRQGRVWAEPGDVVLLSPACASFDLFKNYQDRGDKFKAAVRNLGGE
ncbi:UDP-N-acetylmuramoyl-L-alanine--D-glutamate ligase [Dyadobacter sp. 32]|uniref:UDP-N-acetylmuramoyl-L-alanine--D-glutamate ligase n=1 Tax=Dyadobacter sp. 32 TaxID=538966 RepID=UPI0011EE0071